MPWKLSIIITQGPQKGERYEFVQDSVLIGRSSRADLVLKDSAVSAEHCRIRLGEEAVEIEDLGSKNGTFVNQLAVERSVLRSGDKIQLGTTELGINLEPLSEQDRLNYALYSSLLIAGFNELERKFLEKEATKSLLARRALSFPTGEELLIEIARWLEQGQSPGLVILDIKMPIINGINTAISLRAYERVYQTSAPCLIVFFADQQESEAFKKVLTFCSPALYFPRQAEKFSFEQSARRLIKNLRRTSPQAQN